MNATRALSLRSLMLATAVVLGATTGHVFAAESVTLTYRETNRWVAQDDRAGLNRIIRAAKRGTADFTLVLPTENRELSHKRVRVLMNILHKHQPRNTLRLKEVLGSTAPNTIRVMW